MRLMLGGLTACCWCLGRAEDTWILHGIVATYAWMWHVIAGSPQLLVPWRVALLLTGERQHWRWRQCRRNCVRQLKE